MSRIEFTTDHGLAIGHHDAAIVLAGEDPREALIDAIIESIATEIEITVGGVKMHLAAWMYPAHWDSDWAEALSLEDQDATLAVDALVADAVIETAHQADTQSGEI